MYFVRWFDPRREFPLRRDFHTKRERDQFLETLPFLYDTGTHYRADRALNPKGPKRWPT
jgi:hypothetical protein